MPNREKLPVKIPKLFAAIESENENSLLPVKSNSTSCVNFFATASPSRSVIPNVKISRQSPACVTLVHVASLEFETWLFTVTALLRSNPLLTSASVKGTLKLLVYVPPPLWNYLYKTLRQCIQM